MKQKYIYFLLFLDKRSSPSKSTFCTPSLYLSSTFLFDNFVALVMKFLSTSDFRVLCGRNRRTKLILRNTSSNSPRLVNNCISLMNHAGCLRSMRNL